MCDSNLGSSQTFSKSELTLHTISRLYGLMLGASDVSDDPGAFLRFHHLWSASDVYEIPCGYLRFEPYPHLRAATVHGIFDSNPFYHTNLVKELLDFYLEHDGRVDRLECHIPRRFGGLHKLVSSLANVSKEDGDKIIYHYWS
jgi:hypothetical protein